MPRWETASQRFWAKVRRGDDCWEWHGATSDTGYGSFYAGRSVAAHRYSWEEAHGPIPSGLCVLHHCDNRRCVRPDHLFLGSRADNSRDMARKGREVVPHRPGESHHGARLTEEAVRHIRASDAPGRELAALYGVSPSLITLVRKRKAWTHI